MIENIDRIKVGDEVWYCRVQLSSERRSFLYSQPPRKIMVEKISSSSMGYSVWTCKDEKGKSLTLSVYAKDGYYADNEFLFEKREDAVQYWNSTINNGIDWLDFSHQENVKRLKSKLLKK